MAGKSRRSYKGAAVNNTIASGGLAANATSITVTDNMSTGGWPTTSEPFFCVIEPGTSREEKVCVIYANTTTLTVVDPSTVSSWSANVAGRGVDNTTDREHAAGSVIYPVFTAFEANQANELVAKYQGQGALVYQGASTFQELTVGTAGQVLKVNSGATAPEWGQAATAGIADAAVTSAKIASAALKLLCPVGTIAAYGGASAPTGWLLCDGSAINASYTELIALVGANAPDMRGRFPIGDNASLTLLGTGGSATIAEANLPAHTHGVGTLATASAGSHQHTYVDRNHDDSVAVDTGFDYTVGYVQTQNRTTDAAGAHTHTLSGSTASTGSGTAYYPPYLAVNYIIKHDY